MSEIQFRARASIGSAVMACQALEMIFALCVRLAFRYKDVADSSDITPLEKNFSKPPMKALLKELRKYVDVSEEFEEKMLDLIDRRHMLIHRWAIEQGGLPNDDASHQRIGDFSLTLANDAIGLSEVLCDYVIDWMRKFLKYQEDHLADNESVWLSRIPEELKELKIERDY